MSFMILSFTSVIDFFVVKLRELSQDLIDNRVIFSQRPEQVFLLHEIESNSLVPVKLAYFSEEGLVLLGGEEFEAEENKPCCKIGVVFSDLIVNLVKSVHIHFFIMFFDKFAIFIILV